MTLPLFAPAEDEEAPGSSIESESPGRDAPALDAAERVARARRERELQRTFRQSLAASMGGRLGKVTFTRNRSTLVSSRFAKEKRAAPRIGAKLIRKRQTIDVRVQRVFAAAPPEVIVAVADIALGRGGEESHHLVRDYFGSVVQEESAAESQGLLRQARPLDLRPKGKVYDLVEIRDRLLGLIVEPVDVHVTWGRQSRKTKRRRQRTVLLGVYIDSDRLIRLHPILDRREVPRFVVESVMYHELLHAVLPVEESGGRRCIHTPEFRRRERLFPQFEDAERWIDRHIFRLLSGK